ncbi:MAG: 50S ribosomal protein L17 [Ignavibacteriaceae bacterium]|nr:50S ribosomal protein L17 [Ignavibacteriaceae bacterium]
MRHQVKGRKLKRTATHRDALLRNLAMSLILHKRIKTTVAKAKELRTFVEPLITKARKGDLNSKRLVMSVLRNKDAGKVLFGEVIEKIGERKGGYTRVIKLGNRLGDAAEVAVVELVDFNAVINEAASSKKEEKAQKKEEKKAKKAAEQKALPPESK